MITGFVMVMMLVIEYINVQTKGHFNKGLSNKPHTQIFFATILGFIPGCLGTFTVVSLFTHRIIGFGALTAALIATSGDEAFFMLSMLPEESLIIMPILFFVALVIGYIVHYAFPDKFKGKFDGHFEVHEHEIESDKTGTILSFSHLKNMSFHRALLLVGIITFIVSVLLGFISHSHAFDIPQAGHTCEAGHHHHDHGHDHGHGSSLGWVEYTFILVSLFALFVVFTASEHFLEDHLWKHILKKHFLRILLWTFGALLFASIIKQYVHLPEGTDIYWLILLSAVLIGMIPESGPHMIFITLFLSGNIPLSILIANSIVQDGHGAIPLFAESPKSFFLSKTINLVVGLVVGGGLLYAGY